VTLPHAQLLYTELNAECDQQPAICHFGLCRQMLSKTDQQLSLFISQLSTCHSEIVKLSGLQIPLFP